MPILVYEETGAARRLGHDVTELDAAGVRRELGSPAFLGGAWYRDTCAMVDPARLARGLRQACLDAGVRLFEHTRAGAIRPPGEPAARPVPAVGPGRVLLPGR